MEHPEFATRAEMEAALNRLRDLDSKLSEARGRFRVLESLAFTLVADMAARAGSTEIARNAVAGIASDIEEVEALGTDRAEETAAGMRQALSALVRILERIDRVSS